MTDFSDQPTVYTTDLIRELSDAPEWEAMVDTMEASPTGSEALLPLTDGSNVPYVFDGDDLWHRGDLKPAAVLREMGEREARKRG